MQFYLDAQESQFFHLLREARGDLFTFPKVGLRSLVYRRRLLPFEIYKTLEDETVDFVLAHPQYLGTVAVVDVGGSPNSERNRLLTQAGIPVLCCDNKIVPTSADLREQIAKTLRSDSTDAGNAKA